MISRKIKENGAALLMVLGAIAFLTSLIVEFAYNSHIAYAMSRNNYNRLQAYYLARSALGFAKLQIKIESEIRSQIAQYSQYLAGVIGSEPLCKLMPFATEMLRGSAGLAETENEAEGLYQEEGEEAVPGESPPPGAEKVDEFEGIMRAAAVGDFLSFEGDFSVACEVEDARFNLNYFRVLNPETPVPEGSKANAYEHHKLLLESLLSSPQYEKIFEDVPERRRRIVNQIADWVDKNTLVDESPGFQAGYEEQDYSDASYQVKNGKFSSIEEVMLIAGMDDNIFQNLKTNITVYGDNKVNLCLSDDEMIKAFVIRYSNSTPEMDPIYPDNEELLTQVIAAVRQACLTPTPQAVEVANAILTVLGRPVEAAQAPKTTTQSGTGQPEEGDEEKTEEAEVKKEGETQPIPTPTTLTEQIVTQNRYYSFDLTGSAGEIILSIRAVLNTENKDPKKWPLLYYRIQ